MKIALVFAACAVSLGAAQYGSVAVTNIKVAMRDGVKLSTDVYRPAQGGKPVEQPLPVLVTRTPYNKKGERSLGEFFARNGFVFVAQDVRGRYESEGRLAPLLNEPSDGYDTLGWAAAQPWSNGKIGTTGASYLAMNQLSTATLSPPNLVVMYLAVGSSNYYREAAYRGGVPSSGWPVWLLFSASTSNRAESEPALKERLGKLVAQPGPWLALHPREREALFVGFPDQLAAYRDFYRHPLHDNYWKQRGYSPSRYFHEMKDVPVLLVSGWYDTFADSALEAFRTLSRLHNSPKHVIIGPWPHGYGKSVCGDASFGKEAEFDERSLQLDWFNHWLKGSRLTHTPAVRYFRMGGGAGDRTAEGKFQPGGERRMAFQWPPPGARERVFYLQSGGRLGSHASGEPATYLSDPEDPVPTLGGRYGPTCIQNQVIDRPDVLPYTGEPLEQPLEAAGKISLTLSVSSDRPDTDFIAKLIDVYPNGYAMNIAEGQIRASYRSGDEKVSMLQPEKVYVLDIDLGSVSHLFGKGHRIRLDVSSTSFPKLEPNPGTGEPQGSWTRRVKARNSIYHDPRHPSKLTLTVLPE